MIVTVGRVLRPADRHPLVIVLFVWAAIVGAGRTIEWATGSYTVPPTEMPWAWLGPVWHIMLLLGSLVALAGVWWRDPITGVLIIRAALYWLTVGASMYAAGLLMAGQYRAGVALGVFGVGFGWRAVEITVHVRAEQHAQAALRDASDG